MKVSRFDGKVRRRASQPNEALRAHVTRVGFDLSLGRTHVAALVYLNESIAQGRHFHKIEGPLRRTFALWASGIHGCEVRGLTVHHYSPDAPRGIDVGLAPHYSLTRAGELVVELLRESGLYDEYAAALPQREAV